MLSNKTYFFLFLHLVLVLGLASGCGARTTPTGDQPAATLDAPVSPGGAALNTPSVEPTAEPTPTATPEPLALRVNGEGVSAAEFAADLAQLQEAVAAGPAGNSTADPAAQRQQAIDNLVDLLLLAQGAAENGYVVDDAALQGAMDRLAEQKGSAQSLKDWAAKRGYTEASFRAALRRQIAAAWQRDHLAEQVPVEAEQIRARQIQTIDENIAKQALEYVKIPGTNFTAYAYNYDTRAGGDLGWFPRGYLLQPEVESAAFDMQPGEISPVIRSNVGYHIVYVIAREPSRALSPDARRVLQHKAIASWLENRRKESSVEVLLP
jgi:parvulin-like peptidyl-prolyl isomerase